VVGVCHAVVMQHTHTMMLGEVHTAAAQTQTVTEVWGEEERLV
jgi:hypothetical protein